MLREVGDIYQYVTTRETGGLCMYSPRVPFACKGHTDRQSARNRSRDSVSGATAGDITEGAAQLERNIRGALEDSRGGLDERPIDVNVLSYTV